MIIFAHFNFFILKLHQRNVCNRHLLPFVASNVNKCVVVDNDSSRNDQSDVMNHWRNKPRK